MYIAVQHFTMQCCGGVVRFACESVLLSLGHAAYMPGPYIQPVHLRQEVNSMCYGTGKYVC